MKALRAVGVTGVVLAVFQALSMGTAVASASVSLDPSAACRDQLRKGDYASAITSCAEASDFQHEHGDAPHEVDDLVLVAQGYAGLGSYQKASEVLNRARSIAEAAAPNRRAMVLGELASIYVVTGQTDEARTHLDAARALADDTLDPGLIARLGYIEGGLLATEGKVAEALDLYRQSARRATDLGNCAQAARSLTSAATAALEISELGDIRPLLQEARRQADRCEPSHDKVYTLLNIAAAERRLAGKAPTRALSPGQIAPLFVTAADLADSLGDTRAASYARGFLAEIYEENGRVTDALALSRRALQDAQRVEASQAQYRWEWQVGRLLARQGELDSAIQAYRSAVGTLQSIRPAMAARDAGKTERFDHDVRPVYVGFVDLLLQHAAKEEREEREQPYLVEARETMELLKVAELQDYFRDVCVSSSYTRVTTLDAVSPTAAIVYPIVLKDRVELLVTIAGHLKRIAVAVAGDAVDGEARAFRIALTKPKTRDYLAHSIRLYDWLVRPLVPSLEEAKVDTLVFVPAGALLTIPLAALNDGHSFVLEKYATAVTPSLNLTDPRPFDGGKLHVLTAGLTQSVQGFPALPGVVDEVAEIQSLYGGDSLINESFRRERIEETLDTTNVDVVHIASHAEFRGDVDNTFLLTFDEKLDMNQLAKLIGRFKYRKRPLELLTLSACETAAGDERAALGFAGVAVRAGAKSTLATLWSISDKASAELIGEFYRKLGMPGVSKAQAIQSAQQKLLANAQFAHPYYWGAFVLINNWL